MALLHKTELHPSKLELLAGWLPAQPFLPSGADADALVRVAGFRFDDPAGQVGIETLLVRAAHQTLQIPLTYRGAPLEGAESSLIGTLEHGVLGTRWVYDALGDPVYLSELVRVTTTGGTEVEMHYEENGVRVAKARVRGTGHPDALVPATNATAPAAPHSDENASTQCTGGAEVLVVRRIGWVQETAASQDGPSAGTATTLLGSWEGVDGALLAVVRPVA
jgi:hypothetical protein